MSFASHPFWQAGFRPFFALACLSGAVLPAAWIAIYTGIVTPLWVTFSIVQWHAHEMFFGFGWAVLGGFLLTASKNWVSIRGYHGTALILLGTAWLIERLGMACANLLPVWLFRLSNNLFLLAIIAMLLWTLLRYRKQDSFRDNYFFVLLLPLFVVAKALLLESDLYHLGVVMTLGLFRLAFLVMLERTLTQFMQNALKASILRNPRLDMVIKGLALLLVFAAFLPTTLAASLNVLLALLLLWRFAFWKPLLAMRRLEIGIMYLAYLGIVAQLLIAALDSQVQVPWTGTLGVHVFSFGVMGLVIPAMITRIANGHTGRPVRFEFPDKLVLWIMICALALRVIGTQLWPASYLTWLELSAACWCISFAILAVRFLPFLLRPRIDGKAG
ncbi:MAG: NnrS family protein [Betaproteobacteria bacterium]|nr:NnrS family protein [Betaproteobacteria bacterium]